MAVVRGKATQEELTLTFNNGDFAVLKLTTERLGFRDEESMLRFVLAALSKSATRSITITDQNGAMVSLSPSEGLLKTDDQTEVQSS